MLATDELKAELAEATRTIERHGLNAGTTGNISVRTESGLVITPSSIPPSELAADMMVEVGGDGRWQGNWRPSSETALHRAVYDAFPAARAVVHTHSDHCVALSCLRQDLPAFHYMVARFGGDSVRCSAYAPFGSEELAAVAVEALEGRSACLLANHGAVVHGKDLKSAVTSAAILETLARQYHLACSLGRPVLLSDAEIDVVRQRYQTYGRQV